MALEDIKTLCEEKVKEDPKFKYDFITDAIDEGVRVERKKGQKLVGEKNDEAKGLRPFKKAVVEELGFKLEDGADLDSFVSDIKSKMKDGENGKKKTGELADLSTKFEKISGEFKKVNDKLTASEKKNEDLAVKSKNASLTNKLTKALGDKVYGADFAIKALISEGKVGLAEDGETPVFKDGDEDIEFDKGVEKFLVDNKSIVKNNQTAGGGSSGSSGGGNGNTKTRAEFDAMTPADRMTFIKTEKGTITD